jgi:hypothetical protein
MVTHESTLPPLPVKTTPAAPAPEKKTFLQRAFGFISSDPSPPPSALTTPSDTEEDEDLEAGHRSNKRGMVTSPSGGEERRPHSSNINTAAGIATGSDVPPPAPHRNIVQPPSPQNSTHQRPRTVAPPTRNIVQPPPPSNPTHNKHLAGVTSPPRPHTSASTTVATPSTLSSPVKAAALKTPQPPPPASSSSSSLTEDMKRRHSISTSRALAQEALRNAEVRKQALQERVQESKTAHISTPHTATTTAADRSPSTTGLSYDAIYPSEHSASKDEEVITETNHQIVGLNIRRENETQRLSRISSSSIASSTTSGAGAQSSQPPSAAAELDYGDSEEDEKEEDQFNATNPLQQRISQRSQPPPTTTHRGLLNQHTAPTPTKTEFEPDNSARALEKRRRSTRFPSIKAKREMFLARSDTGSSVGSNTSLVDSPSVDQQSTGQQSVGAGSATRNSSVTSGRSRGTSATGGDASGMSAISNTSPNTVETALSRRISRKFVTAVSIGEDFTDKVNHFYPYSELKRVPVLRTSSTASSINLEGGGEVAAGAESLPDKDVLQQQFPSDVNPKHREQYLSDFEFESIFHMSKSTFNSQPKWKRQELKKQHHLF